MLCRPLVFTFLLLTVILLGPLAANAQPEEKLPDATPVLRLDLAGPVEEESQSTSGHCQIADTVLVCALTVVIEARGVPTVKRPGAPVDQVLLSYEVQDERGLVIESGLFEWTAPDPGVPIDLSVGLRLFLTGDRDDLSPIEARHILVQQRQAKTWTLRQDHTRDIPLTMQLELPEGVILDRASVHADNVGVDGADAYAESAHSETRVAAASGRGQLDLVLTHDSPQFYAGGPFLSGGCRFSDTFGRDVDSCAPWFAAGWEFAFPGWMLYALAIESDFQSEAVLVPTAAIAIPLHLGGMLAVGLPLEFGQDVDVGVRLYPSIFWGPLQLGAAVDLMLVGDLEVDTAFLLSLSL